MGLFWGLLGKPEQGRSTVGRKHLLSSGPPIASDPRRRKGLETKGLVFGLACGGHRRMLSLQGSILTKSLTAS